MQAVPGRDRADSTSFGFLEHEARVVAHRADALLPAYGDDDVEFALRVAWRNAHPL